MKLQVFNKNSFGIQIDYEQPIPESVCLSEKGFIIEGIKMCSGTVPVIEDIIPSTDSNEFVYYYNIKLK
jgi:hypothetical protein